MACKSDNALMVCAPPVPIVWEAAAAHRHNHIQTQAIAESQAVVDQIVAAAKERLLPQGRELATQLQSRLAALRVLGAQEEFLEHLESAGARC